MTEAQALTYDPIAVSAESTVVAEYVPDTHAATDYQSEAALEAEFIALLQEQAYEYLPVTSEAQLISNLRAQLEVLNNVTFSDAEWEQLSSPAGSLSPGTALRTRPSDYKRTTSSR